MNSLYSIIVVLQVVSSLVIIGLVLLQHGKGADMGAAFGSGASGSLFGATGSSSFMSKATALAAAIFMTCTLALAYIATNRHSTGGIMDSVVPTKAVSASASAKASAAASAAASVAAPAAPAPVPAPAPANQVPK
ncbi:MAG: preprotein translocase subunit SecG [Pseudomonadota bacterium]|jgi:preprotein translocase subunit SecG